MDFNLTSEQLFVQETLRKFMARECPREQAHELDEQGAFPADLLAKLAEMGFCSLNVPEEYGGAGRDVLAAAIAVEEIASLSPALAGLFASVTFYGGQALATLGSQAQQRRLMPDIAQGALLFGYGPEDERVDDGLAAVSANGSFLLNGRLPFASLANRADYLLVQARSGDDGNETTCFVLPADTPGVHCQVTDSVGYRGAEPGQVTFEDVTLTTDHVLGSPELVNGGREQAAYLRAVDHLATAAIALGLAQGATTYTANYAGERVQFGQAIRHFEAVQHKLVDLALALQSTRWLLYHACWLADQDQPFGLEAAMARLQAGDLARQAGLQSVHILGGYGYMAEYDAQRYLRDSLVLLSGSEAEEELKNTIGTMLALDR